MGRLRTDRSTLPLFSHALSFVHMASVVLKSAVRQKEMLQLAVLSENTHNMLTTLHFIQILKEYYCCLRLLTEKLN